MSVRFKTPGGIERSLRRIFDKAGIIPVFGHGSKHPYVRWTNRRGEDRQMFFSNSPRSAAGEQYAKRQLKKMLEDKRNAIGLPSD